MTDPQKCVTLIPLTVLSTAIMDTKKSVDVGSVTVQREPQVRHATLPLCSKYKKLARSMLSDTHGDGWLFGIWWLTT